MSEPTVARFDSQPRFDIQILVRRVADESSVSETTCQSNCSLAELGEAFSQDVAVHPCRLEFLDPPSGLQENDTAIGQDLAAIDTRLLDGHNLLELEAIRIDYERARPTKTRKDYVLPLQDWLCILSIIGFELTAFVLLLGS